MLLRRSTYLRGEIKDENNNLLPNVKILLHSSGIYLSLRQLGGFWDPYTRITDGHASRFPSTITRPSLYG